jgi:hypothetical protein
LFSVSIKLPGPFFFFFFWWVLFSVSVKLPGFCFCFCFFFFGFCFLWQLLPPRNQPQRSILLRICFFFLSFFLYLFFRKNLRLRICFFFNLFFGLKNKKKKWAEKSKATYLLLF